MSSDKEDRNKIKMAMADSPLVHHVWTGSSSVEVYDDQRRGWVVIGHPREICEQQNIREYIETQYAISVLQGGEIGPPF